jgi:hypothetical protein
VGMRLRVARLIIRSTGPILAENTTLGLQIAHKTGQALKFRELLKPLMSCFRLQWNPFALGLICDSVG